MAIFAALSSLTSDGFRTKSARSAARRSVNNRMSRQFILFYAYIFIILMIVLDQVFDFGHFEDAFSRVYISCAVGALVWSLELPRALSSVHDDSLETISS
jgi:hypothetical protein